jgi:NADH:ubiquinone oxidoreductase subunit H
MGQPVQESRGYDFVPLWAVPLLLLVAIVVLVRLGFVFGLAGFLLALVAVWWLERKADAFVRRREGERD